MASFRCPGIDRGYADAATAARPSGLHVIPPIRVTAPHPMMMRGRHARLASRDYSGSAIL